MNEYVPLPSVAFDDLINCKTLSNMAFAYSLIDFVRDGSIMKTKFVKDLPGWPDTRCWYMTLAKKDSQGEMHSTMPEDRAISDWSQTKAYGLIRKYRSAPFFFAIPGMNSIVYYGIIVKNDVSPYYQEGLTEDMTFDEEVNSCEIEVLIEDRTSEENGDAECLLTVPFKSCAKTEEAILRDFQEKLQDENQAYEILRNSKYEIAESAKDRCLIVYGVSFRSDLTRAFYFNLNDMSHFLDSIERIRILRLL